MRPFKGRGSRLRNLDSGGGCFLKCLCHRLGGKESFLLGDSPDLNQQHPHERGMAKVFTKGDFLVEEPRKIMMPRILHRRTYWRKSLHNHLTLRLTATGTTGNLSEQLKGSLSCTEVWRMQADVCIDNTDKRHIGKIEALGNHLRSDQNIDLTGAEFSQYLPIGAFLTHCIGIHPGNARCGEKLSDRLLDALGADSGVLNAGIPAFRAAGWGFCLMTAQMAGKPIFRTV